jgi:hypothetical protein
MQLAQNAQGLLDALPGDVFQTFLAKLALNVNIAVPSFEGIIGGAVADAEGRLAKCGGGQTVSMTFGG